MPKIISILGVVAAVALAIAGQLGAINGRWELVAMAVAAVASAAGGALSKFTGGNHAVTIVGLVVAVSGALAGFNDLLGAGLAQVIAIIGTAAAAAGKALWPESNSTGN